MKDEVWVPIAGYESMYAISNYGRVKSLQRWRRGKSGSMVPIKEKIMKLSVKKRSKDGRTLPYIEVKLRDGSPRHIPCKSFLVHRLVAQAFVGELFEGCNVDHIDCDHSNNHFSNLRILSAIEHGRLHPCIADKERNMKFQQAAQAAIKKIRENNFAIPT